MNHWFNTLGNADWFGIKTIEKLVQGGFDSLEKVYDMGETDFVELGFGPVQSKNLAEALVTSRSKMVEDWRFLAAFGIPELGRADSRKLLSHITLEDIFGITADDLEKIDGFGAITSREVVSGISLLKPTIKHMLHLEFNLERSSTLDSDNLPEHPLSGKGMVFTGKMQRGNREEMQNEARRYGANVQTAVSGKTDYLVCGENVGQNKIQKAQSVGAKIISEKEYYGLLESA
jgi:DNA ligase (NAD+)